MWSTSLTCVRPLYEMQLILLYIFRQIELMELAYVQTLDRFRPGCQEKYLTYRPSRLLSR